MQPPWSKVVAPKSSASFTCKPTSSSKNEYVRVWVSVCTLTHFLLSPFCITLTNTRSDDVAHHRHHSTWVQIVLYHQFGVVGWLMFDQTFLQINKAKSREKNNTINRQEETLSCKIWAHLVHDTPINIVRGSLDCDQSTNGIYNINATINHEQKLGNIFAKQNNNIHGVN